MPEFGIIALTPSVVAVPQAQRAAQLQMRQECAVAAAASRAGAIGILDIEHKSKEFNLEQALSLLQTSGGAGETGIKCGIKQVPAVLDAVCACKDTGRQLQYVVLSMACAAGDGSSSEQLPGIVASLKEFGLKVFAEVVNVEEAKRAEKIAGVDAVIGRGNESPGRAGEETAFVLLQRLCKTVKLPVWIQGGIGTHTIAACAVGGAQGVVLESELLLARESPAPPELRARLRRSDGLESTFGQSVALADSLANRGRTVAGIIIELRRSLNTQLEQAAVQAVLSEESPLAQSHGTRFPILQGAMTRVSDTAQFASCVAAGGALPFLALALMRGRQVEKLLSDCKTTLKEHPWGVGILGFVPEPLWHEQIEAVLAAKPPYALIAGGRPDQSKLLEQAGIKTYLHVPSPLLLSAFIDEGARRFIFEGRECGGHVGPRSSFILWQQMIDVLLEKVAAKSGSKEDASAYHIIFAGGIHDSVSAAMTAALAAPLAAAGVRVGVLLGTAYLFTQEAVSSGAIVETFQRKAIECTTTALLETGPGHSIRVIDSPYRQTFEARRAELQMNNKSREEVREQLELMNLGRLRVASKGLMRAAGSGQDVKSHADVSDRYAELLAQNEALVPVSDEQQWQDGMYMIGQAAALHDKTLTIEQLHKDISEHSTQHLKRMLPSAPVINVEYVPPVPQDTREKPPIAIIGMSCMLPQANDIEKFWQNILNRVDSITEVPEKYWDWKKLYNPDPLAEDKVVSKWGGFLDAVEFDPTAYGIPPSSMSSVDPMQLLILEAARRALIDAGYEERDFPKAKTSVILANAGHGPVTALYSLRSMLDWKLAADLTPEQRGRLEQILPEWTEDSFPGTLGNVTAGRVSNRFDLGGLNFSIDAACASSLAALYIGINDLRNGNSDMVLLSSTDTHNQPGDYLSFSKTHALSPDGRCKTFDASANGIVISEGIAVLVLKRLADAEADGDTIYAVIKGVGGSSDGRALSLTAPRPAGQLLALKRAYEDAAVQPSSVSLIEAHGTGTVAGDKAEIEALSKMFSAAGAGTQVCAVGSVKSNIGHTKCTAGLASIIKVSKALHHKVLPPTIGVKTPNASCNFGNSPFYIASESRPWFAPQQPRRAGVSAFGFGGTNFHAVLEEYTGGVNIQEPGAGVCFPSELFVFRAASVAELKKQVAHFESDVRANLNGGTNAELLLSLYSFRLYLRNAVTAAGSGSQYCGITLAVVATSLPDLLKKLQTINTIPEDWFANGFKDPQGIYLQDTSGIAEPGLITFLFPGQGSQRLNMLSDLSMYFPMVRHTFEQADRVYEAVAQSEADSVNQITRYIFPPPSFTEQEVQLRQRRLTDTSIAQAAIGVADLAMCKLLRDFGVEPCMLAGHSYGEYAALAAAGAISEKELVEISALRGRLMSRCNDGAMAAVAGDAAVVLNELRGAEFSPGRNGQDITIANYNAPKQTVLSGPEDKIDAAITILRKQGYDARRLPVSAAFHCDSMQGVCAELEVALKACKLSPLEITVYSNLTGQPHSNDTESIVRNLTEHTVKPVRFMQEIEQLYADGARTYVEVGPGSVLTNLVDSILADKPHLAISTDRSGRNGVTQFQHALAALAASGVNLNLRPLFENRYQELEAAERLLKKSKEAAAKKKSVKYLINSYCIERISGDEGKLLPVGGQVDRAATKNIKADGQTARASNRQRQNGPQFLSLSDADRGHSFNGSLSAVVENTMTNMSQAVDGHSGSVESVMLQFQQTMAQMTNNFLQAQQNVMLAYLSSVSGGAEQNIGASAAPPAVPIAYSPAAGTVPPATVMPFSSTLVPATTMSFSSTPVLAAAMSVPSSPADASIHVLSPESSTASITPVPVETAVVESAVILNADELIAGLIDIVSERTGYPPEMLEPNLDLEADLGIDSIKRIEILSTFRKMLPAHVITQLEGSVERLASTRTLAGIFDWIRETASSAGTQPLSPAISQKTEALAQDNTAPATTTASQEITTPIQDNSAAAVQGQIARGIVKVIDLPATSAPATMPPGTVLIDEGMVGTGNTHSENIAAKISAKLQEHGCDAVLLSDALVQQGFCRADLADESKTKTLFEHIRTISRGSIVGSVHLNALTQSNCNTDEIVNVAMVLKALKKEFDLQVERLTQVGPYQRPFVLAVTQLGGTFGFGRGAHESEHNATAETDSYEQAGIVGLIKTVSREWTDVHSRAVDFEASASAEEVADRLIDEILDVSGQGDGNISKQKYVATAVDTTNRHSKVDYFANSAQPATANDVDAVDRYTEVGYVSWRRCGLQIESAPIEPTADTAVSLNSNSVILLTGGARGITAQLTIALAQRFQPALILVGRQPPPGEDEFAQLHSARELKAALMEQMRADSQPVVLAKVEARYRSILKDREIKKTLAAVENAGARVEYHCLDVCNEEAFGRFIDEIYEKHEKLDGVVHGAGIIEDAYLVNKQAKSIRRVIDTKVVPARVLARKLQFDRLQFLFFLSSIVSRTGNTGQADYVAANEILNKLAVKLNRMHKVRTASLLWGPWNGGMARPELESLFARYGWTMIGNEQGQEAFINELLRGGKRDEEVLLVAQTTTTTAPANTIAAPAVVTGASVAVTQPVAATPAAAPAVTPHAAGDAELVPQYAAGSGGNGNGDNRHDGNGDGIHDNGAHDNGGNGAHGINGAHGNGHDNMVHEHGNGGNGHDEVIDPESHVIVKASGARLFNSYALEKSNNAMSVHFTLSTQEDLYLNDHRLDGSPVLPMAMATELLVEAGSTFDDKLHPSCVSDLRIPSGIIFDESSKNFVIRLESAVQTGHMLGDKTAGQTSVVKAYLSSVGSKERSAPSRVRFTCNIKLAAKEQLPLLSLPKGLPATYTLPQFVDENTDLPAVSDVYHKWFFHGPTFQGIQEILAVGIDGIAGTILGSSPTECLKTTNGEHWLIDPILLDSAMQLAGIWAWKYLDMMVLPTGFQNLHLFKAPSRQVHHVIVRIPQAMLAGTTTLAANGSTVADSSTTGSSTTNFTAADTAVPAENTNNTAAVAGNMTNIAARAADHSELLCDLAIYGPSGEMVMLMEGLSGIGSRSFNRLVEKPKQQRARG